MQKSVIFSMFFECPVNVQCSHVDMCRHVPALHPPKDPRQAALALGRPRRPNESAEWHAQCRRPQTIFATTSIDSSFAVT